MRFLPRPNGRLKPIVHIQIEIKTLREHLTYRAELAAVVVAVLPDAVQNVVVAGASIDERAA